MVVVEEAPTNDLIFVAVIFAMAFIIWTQYRKLADLSNTLLEATPAWMGDILRDVVGGGTEELKKMAGRTSIDWDDQIAAYIDGKLDELLAKRANDGGASDEIGLHG